MSIIQPVFKLIKPTEEIWTAIENSADSSVFVSRQWHLFLNKRHQQTVIVEIAQEGMLLGYFVGSRMFGLPIMGAPLSGAGTYLGGIVALETITTDDRVKLYSQLYRWLRRSFKAFYLQITDWQLRIGYEDFVPYETWEHPVLKENGLFYRLRTTYCVDTSVTEQEMWARSSYSSFRYCVNKAKKEGLKVISIDKRSEIPQFVKTLHEQVLDVSERKKSPPHLYHSYDSLLSVCEALFPNRVLMLQVQGKDENGDPAVLSSAVFCVDKGVSTFYAAASFHRYMKLCPNEIMVWEGLCELHRRGVHSVVLTGVAPYKKKFGSALFYLPKIVFSPGLFKNISSGIRKFLWRIRGIKYKRNNG